MPKQLWNKYHRLAHTQSSNNKAYFARHFRFPSQGSSAQENPAVFVGPNYNTHQQFETDTDYQRLPALGMAGQGRGLFKGLMESQKKPDSAPGPFSQHKNKRSMKNRWFAPAVSIHQHKLICSLTHIVTLLGFPWTSVLVCRSPQIAETGTFFASVLNGKYWYSPWTKPVFTTWW